MRRAAACAQRFGHRNAPWRQKRVPKTARLPAWPRSAGFLCKAGPGDRAAAGTGGPSGAASAAAGDRAAGQGRGRGRAELIEAATAGAEPAGRARGPTAGGSTAGGSTVGGRAVGGRAAGGAWAGVSGPVAVGATQTSSASAGSQRRPWRGRAAAPRPSTATAIQRASARPDPSSTPVQQVGPVRTRTSAPGQASPNASKTVPRSRARAVSLRASPVRTGPGGLTATASNPSMRAAATAAQSRPGCGTRAKRSRAMPTSAAARMPSQGRPMAAHHEPAFDGPARTARRTAVEPETATVPPRRSPPPGRSGRSASMTGSVRSPAMRTGRCRSASSRIA
jgi:hypothetical protein